MATVAELEFRLEALRAQRDSPVARVRTTAGRWSTAARPRSPGPSPSWSASCTPCRERRRYGRSGSPFEGLLISNLVSCIAGAARLLATGKLAPSTAVTLPQARELLEAHRHREADGDRVPIIEVWLAKAPVARTWRPSSLVSASSRATSLTVEPMTENERCFGSPMLPNRTSPRCSAKPNAS